MTCGGRGGTGGKSFGRGGMSRTSRTPLTPLTPAEVQLDEPDNESEPSTKVGSAVLGLRSCCRGDTVSPLATLLGSSGTAGTMDGFTTGKAGAGNGGI